MSGPVHAWLVRSDWTVAVAGPIANEAQSATLTGHGKAGDKKGSSKKGSSQKGSRNMSWKYVA